MTMHQTKKVIAALGATLALGGCGELDIPDLNNPSLDDFRENPTPSAVYSAATGLQMGHRVGVAAQNGYVAELGVIGREAFIFDGAEPRLVEELLGPSLDPGGPAFGGNFWAAPYANIRNANTLLGALDKVVGVSDGAKAGVRGFAKTMQALDFLVVINTRDTNGAPIDVDRPLGAELPPIESKEVVLNHIATLLDDGYAQLTAEGTTIPFALSSGFSGITLPQFNRAVRSRVAVYQGQHADALAALSQSFLNPADPLTKGVYHTFSTDPGDLDNNLLSTNIFAHPSIVADAELKGDGTVDNRVATKVRKLAADDAGSAADGRLNSDLAFTLYPSGNSSVPIIRNEELILLRAEANIGLGNLGPAADDLNFIRTTSGGLPGRTDLNADNIVDELLKQRRYSLLFEGGHRWIDLRRHNRLNTLPRELDPSFAPHERFPIPAAEMDARQ
jgi:hypothetical protein